MPLPEIICYLKAIQEMKFDLQTSFGGSDGSYSGKTLQPFQILCQGKGGVPAG